MKILLYSVASHFGIGSYVPYAKTEEMKEKDNNQIIYQSIEIRKIFSIYCG